MQLFFKILFGGFRPSSILSNDDGETLPLGLLDAKDPRIPPAIKPKADAPGCSIRNLDGESDYPSNLELSQGWVYDLVDQDH